MNIAAIFIFLLGFWAFFSAYKNDEYFMNHKKARRLIMFVGNRNNARVFYLFFGIILMIIGFFIFFD